MFVTKILLQFFIKSLPVYIDNEQEDDETHTTRYKPEGLDALCQSTKFSRKELQILYRGFKQVRTFFYETLFKDYTVIHTGQTSYIESSAVWNNSCLN